jgi:hypothetical protein
VVNQGCQRYYIQVAYDMTLKGSFLMKTVWSFKSETAKIPVVSSNYWNVKLNGEDPYGEEILKTLGKNMAKELQNRS